MPIYHTHNTNTIFSICIRTYIHTYIHTYINITYTHAHNIYIICNIYNIYTYISMTVCYYNVTYEFQSESLLYRHLLRARSSLTFRQTIECGFTLKLVRDMIITYSQMSCTDKYHNTAQLFGQFG